MTLPPGRARLATSPTVTGSLMAVKTIGIVEVAAFAASAAERLPLDTIKSTLRPTKSVGECG